MKRILLSLVAFCGMTSAMAEDKPVFDKVAIESGVTTLRVIKDCATLQFEYADGANGAWGVGMRWPAGYVMYDDAELSVTPYTPYAFGLDQYSKIDQVTEVTGNKMYINCGCNIKANDGGFSEETTVKSGASIYDGDNKSNGILKVTVKADGVLGFKAFCGSNNRSVGIYTLPTAQDIAEASKILTDAEEQAINDMENGMDEDEALAKYAEAEARAERLKVGHMVHWFNMKSAITEDPSLADEHNVAQTGENEYYTINAPVEAGREYLLMCSDVSNHNLFEITFKNADQSSISSVAADKVAAKGIFNLAGQRVNESYKGIVIKDGKKILNK